MATKFKMLAVLSVTSNAIQKSQIVSLSSQSTLTFNFPVDFVIHNRGRRSESVTAREGVRENERRRREEKK